MSTTSSDKLIRQILSSLQEVCSAINMWCDIKRQKMRIILIRRVNNLFFIMQVLQNSGNTYHVAANEFGVFRRVLVK
jgi:hypothetical protein